jgi:flagellar basal body-associated protein FliL
MKTSTWIILLVVLVALAVAIGYYLSTIKKVITNRDKIAATANIAEGFSTLIG